MNSFLEKNRLAFYLLLLLIFGTLLAIFIRPLGFQWDFFVYYDAGMSIRLGVNPYTLEGLKALGLGHSPLTPSYLPLTLCLFVPLSFLPIGIAAQCYFLLKCAALVYLYRVLSSYFVKINLFNSLNLIILFLAFNSTLLWDLSSGNILTFLSLFLFLAAKNFLKEKYWRFCFWILLAASFKIIPLFFLLFFALDFSFLRKQGWRFFLGSLVFFSFFIGLNFLIFPDLMSYFYKNSTHLVLETGILAPSLFSFFHDIFLIFTKLSFVNLNLNAGISKPFYFLSLIFIAWISFKKIQVHSNLSKTRREKILFQFSILILVFLLCVPRIKSYDFVYAIPVLFYFLPTLSPSKKAFLLTLLCLPVVYPVGGGLDQEMVSSAHLGFVKKILYLFFQYLPCLGVLLLWTELVTMSSSKKTNEIK